MIPIVYASTSGSTELVAVEIARQLGPKAQLVNLRDFEETDLWHDTGAELVVAGGPTYGQGDWHYLWEAKVHKVLPLLVGAKRVALFGLGDARFHGVTFCGALGKLHDAVVAAGVKPIGTTDANKYAYEATPSLRGGAFPGFVLDYKQDRRRVQDQVNGWFVSLQLPRALWRVPDVA
jgi:flavodoxin